MDCMRTFFQESVMRRLAGPATCVVVACMLAAVSTSAEESVWMTDYEAAVALAEAEGKPLLLEFTGSDWCAPCIALESKVLSSELFSAEASKLVVLVKLDYPMRTPQSDELKQQNKQLKERYPHQGFPTLLLIDPSGQAFWSKTGYSGEAPEFYLAELKAGVELQQRLSNELTAARALEGVAKIEALHRVLSGMDYEFAVGYFQDTLDQVITEADEAGLALGEEWRSKLAIHRFEQELVRVAWENRASFEVVPDLIDEVIAKHQPTGETLQKALVGKAQVLSHTGQDDKARAVYVQALEEAPDSEFAPNIRKVLEEQPEAQQAASEHEDA